MEKTITKSNAIDDNVSFLVGISVLTTLFLFYIDEGYYSFAWMKEWGSWIVFLIYVGVFTFIQYIIRLFFLKSVSVIRRNVVIASIGIPLGLVFLYLVFNLIR
jgi:nitric oxide reductase large subunit